VTEAIKACEVAWGGSFDGDAAAVDAVRRLPEYTCYAQTLRALLRFPLTLYHVTTAELYDRWRSGTFNRPIGASFSLEIARLVHDVYPDPPGPLVLVTGTLIDPEAVIMRGRVQGYELVVDSGRIRPVDVSVVEG
jgi:hypothetical protein